MTQEVATKQDIQMIFDLIKEFKNDVDRRFEQIDKRLDQVDSRFEQIEESLRDLKQEFRYLQQDIRSDRDKLQQVYEARDKVKISFGWQWGTISLFIAVAAAFLGSSLTVFFS